MSKIRNLSKETYYGELRKILGGIANCSVNGGYVYLLDFGDGYYKFGLTTNIITRMTTHFRHHQFHNVVKTWECGEFVREVEKSIKEYAIRCGILETYRKETEVIKTADIGVVINYIDDIVSKLPKNNVPKSEFGKIVEDVLVKRGLNKVLQRGQIVIASIKKPQKEFKCDKCGKVFDKKCNLDTHKNRKKPCPEKVDKPQPVGPPKCNTCSKEFSTKSSLTRHSKTCMIKIDRKKRKDDEIAELKKELKELKNTVEEMRKNSNGTMVNNTLPTQQTTNVRNNANKHIGDNIDNSIDNSTTNNITNNVTFINNYNSPDVSKITIDTELIKKH
jgi:predicted GIY-YIG superfamily endonuclease